MKKLICLILWLLLTLLFWLSFDHNQVVHIRNAKIIEKQKTVFWLKTHGLYENLEFWYVF